MENGRNGPHTGHSEMGSLLRRSYGPHPSQFGELRLPHGEGPHPVVVAVHGGWWRAQHGLDGNDHLCEALRSAGVATWNLEYSRVGGDRGGWPEGGQDVLGGILHLAALARELPLDLSKIVLMGFSAGGHLAFWAASEWGRAQRPFPLRGAVSLAGVLDLRWAATRDLGQGAVLGLLGESRDNLEALYREASPIERMPLGTPQILVHGSRDTSVPLESSRRYQEKAVKAGDLCALLVAKKQGHFDLIDPSAQAWPLVQSAVLGLMGAENARK